MANELRPHTIISTMYGATVRVLRKLGGGGQGDVYEVEYRGKRKALKWYHVNKISNLNSFVKNLKRNITMGSPTQDFLWPIDMTEFVSGSFGYVMDLCPEGYEEAKELLIGNVRFASYRRRIDACLNIVSAFRILHGKGFSYQDVNAGNFFIDPRTGKVLICDNDNVTTNGEEMGVLGTLSYMAPEIVTRKSFPNKYSDRHSLAVLLFRLLLGPHPLEGARSVNTVLDSQMRRSLYGENALFVMDPHDRSNAPDPIAQEGLVSLWNQMPEHLKKLFTNAFSQEALHDPLCRPLEADWQSSLARFRSEVLTCGCGNEVCCESGMPVPCDACKQLVCAPFVAVFREMVLPVALDTRIYRCQLGNPGISKALDLVAYVTGAIDDPYALGLRNMDSEPWEVHTRWNERHLLRQDEVVQVEEGLRVAMPGTRGPVKVRFERNAQTVRK